LNINGSDAAADLMRDLGEIDVDILSAFTGYV
jgi:hypothetical protein